MTSAPAGGSGQGIVETFPSDVILVPESSHVRSTSVSSDNGLVQVTLDAAVPTTCAETLVDYRGWFGRGGFVETSTSESADRAQVSFTRGGDVVTLTTLAGADACDVAVVAVLEVAG